MSNRQRDNYPSSPHLKKNQIKDGDEGKDPITSMLYFKNVWIRKSSGGNNESLGERKKDML